MPQQLAIGLAIHQAIRHVRCIFVAFFPANFRLKDAGKVNRSIKDIPETRLLECADPPANPQSPTYPSFNLSTDKLPITVKLKDFAWLLARSLTRVPTSNGDDTNGEDSPLSSSLVPVWSGYNSLVHETVPVARIGSLPLLAAPAHEWSTLLTIFMQAQQITAHVVGPGRKTVISLDMGLYHPAKKLQMVRNDESSNSPPWGATHTHSTTTNAWFLH